MKTRAVRLYGKDDLRLEEFELPPIREDEILARVVEGYRKLRNTCRMLVGNLNDFDPATDAVALAELAEIDRCLAQGQTGERK